jgi:aldose 1-epimerase
MRLSTIACLLALAAATTRVTGAQQTVTSSGDLLQLKDAAREITVSIVPSLCNAYEMTVKGQQVIRRTFTDLSDFRARPGLNGIPLLAPFANRLDQQAFFANGRKYNFDMELGNVRGAIPIHGFLAGARDWRLVEARAGGGAAWATCTLDFYRHPEWMKQFPFAHTLTLTYRLQDGALEVRMRIENLSIEPMPVAIGFHPYFQLTDSPHDEWALAIPAQTHWRLNANLIPTGETDPIERTFADPRKVPLRNVDLDDVFSDLVRDAEGRAIVTLRGRHQQLDVLLGPHYRALVLYSPNRAAYVAIEPMAGITDAMNLAQTGVYRELQRIAPGGAWQESFWIRPSGF